MKKLLVVLVLILGTINVFAAERSNQWDYAKKIWLKTNPVCQICGMQKDRQVHHVMIFSRHPELELNQDNYITLCISKYWGYNCHLIMHGGNFQYENPWAKEDTVKLHLIMDPKYIRTYSDKELINYIKKMKDRIKKYNCDTYI